VRGCRAAISGGGKDEEKGNEEHLPGVCCDVAGQPCEHANHHHLVNDLDG